MRAVEQRESNYSQPYHKNVGRYGGLEASYKILLIHCKSRDNDLGVHNLTVGNEFMWKFKPAIFGSTLFYCFMASEFDHVHATFNVFWDNQDLFYWCNWKLCSWIGEDDGIYLKNIPEKYGEFNHKWESGRELHANYTIV
ncbi:hypothetical protein V6N13_068673 [Hibiscus sabdariffa]